MVPALHTAVTTCSAGVFLTCAGGVSLATLTTGAWIMSAAAMWTTYNDLFDCVSQEATEYGSTTIAIMSPPLPFSGQVFVQSIPSKVNVGTGFISLDPSPDEIGQILESSVPNAEFVFLDERPRHEIIEGTTQVDTGLRVITTAYISKGFLPAPQCP